MRKHGSGRVAYCYARALLDMVVDSADSICEEIRVVRDALAADDGVRAFFASPVTPKEHKVEVLQALGESCKLNRALVGFMCVVVRDSKFYLLPDMFEEFSVLLMRARGQFALEMTTASPTSAVEEKKILSIVKSEYGEPATVTKRVDPAILGGFVAKMDSLVIDASFSGHLRELERVSRSVVCGV